MENSRNPVRALMGLVDGSVLATLVTMVITIDGLLSRFLLTVVLVAFVIRIAYAGLQEDRDGSQ